jgi:putative ABC transport system permease protein
MEQIYDTALAPRRSQLILLGSFAGIALVLSVLGVYGAFTYAGVSRSRKIAIRVALGASQTSILQLVLRRTLIAIGLSIGVGLTVFAERIIRGSLYGVSPFDPGLNIEVTALLASTAFIGSLVPAFRASRADSLPVLREE